MKMPRSINQQVQDNARTSTGWRHHKEAQEVYALFNEINGLLFEGNLPAAVIGFNSQVRAEGNYHWEGDDISLPFHMDIQPGLGRLWTLLALLHNAVHIEQETYQDNKSWWHKVHFRVRMLAFGVQVSPDGSVVELKPEFLETLHKIGENDLIKELEPTINPVKKKIDTNPPIPKASPIPIINDGPPLPTSIHLPENMSPTFGVEYPMDHLEMTPVLVKPLKNTSKMKKWVCGCSPPVIGRFATEVEVMCLKCKCLFTKVE